MDALGILALGIVMLVGLVGVVIPFIPGLPLVWGAGLLYGLAEGFGTIGWLAFGAMTILLVIGTVAGFVLPQRKVTEAGAPRSTLVAGLAGAVIGFFVVPVVGLPLGAVAGVLLAEQARTSDWEVAWRSTRALVVGFGLGALAQLGVGVLMAICWVGWVVAD